MQGMLFDHIQNLDKSRSNWRIKARLTRFWKTFSPETSTIKGYNLILLDDDNSHVHAYVYPDNWRAIDKEVVEGNVYVIENFQVWETVGKLKPVSTRLCIRLLSSTYIEPVADDAMIPRHKFEFMDMGDLLDECNRLIENQNPEFAYDVIGAVEHFKKVKRVQTSLRFKVTLWGELASSVSESFKHDLEKPVIGILTSAKLSNFREEQQFGALPSTKIYFNLAIDSVAEFRERLIEEGYKAPDESDEGTSEPPVTAVIEKTSFRDLIENSVTYRDKVEDEDNWWFNSCVSCQAEVEKIDKKFKCPECKRSFGYSEKRFRIVVLADDSTLVTNVLLLDRFVKRVAGTTVANILNEIKKDSSVTVLSSLFKTIIGKEVTVLIKLTDANVAVDSNLYNAVDLFDSATSEAAIVEAHQHTLPVHFQWMGIMFARLCSLQISRNDSKIKIRVTRTWDSFSDNEEFIGMNMIIIDVEEFHIHAFVIPEACSSLGFPIFEGNMYVIENFVTRRAIGDLRPVTSDVCIIINESSNVTPVPLEIGRFPRYKFEITELGDVYSIARNLAPYQLPIYAIDIVGIILDCGEVEVDVSGNGERNYVRFNIYDGRNMVRVMFWDEKIELLKPLFDRDFPTNPIVILSSMQPHFYKGILQVSTTSPSRVYINLVTMQSDKFAAGTQHWFAHFERNTCEWCFVI
ncbi:hypothetical protein ACET3Z_010538 [Daucus carota]